MLELGQVKETKERLHCFLSLLNLSRYVNKENCVSVLTQLKGRACENLCAA